MSVQSVGQCGSHSISLCYHVAEKRTSDLELSLSDQAVIVVGLSTWIVASENIFIPLVVVRVYAVQRADLILSQTCRRVLSRTTQQCFGAEAGDTFEIECCGSGSGQEHSLAVPRVANNSVGELEETS